MRRDSIFYALFRQSPSLLFDLLDRPPACSEQYRFESVAVKEPKFEIDGVFLPPESDPPGTVFFTEVQMQKDDHLYERLFGESMLYFYRNRDYYSDWQAIVIYPTRSTEQTDTHPYRAFLNSDQMQRVYLNELGEMEALPLGVAAMVLTIAKEDAAPEQARMLIARASQEIESSSNRQGIIEIISQIIVYKFKNLSRQEVDAMLGTRFEDTRVYQEAREEGREKGREEGREELRQAIALSMLQDNLPLEQISRLTGLTIAQLSALQTQE